MKRLIVLGVVGISVLAALTVGVGRADAGLFGCRYDASQQRFATFGDGARYVSIPGGTFEGWSTRGWSFSGGARVVDGNEPFHITSADDSSSLLLPPGSSATTPAICMSVLSPSFRFVGQSSGASAVHVSVYTRTLFGLLQLPISATIGVDSAWNASEAQQIVLQNVLGLLNLGRANLYFRFTPVGDSTVQIDDLYLDPYLMR